MEEPNNYENFDNTYKESIKYSLKNGLYFKDAFSWFSTLYLRPLVDRTFFVFMCIMGIAIMYYVISIIFMILPLKEDIFITIKERDLSKFVTSVYDISKEKGTESTDESILKYLLENYVVERESHNYKTANINDINTKLEVIKNNSSSDIYNNFRYFMSADNRNGPFYYFGKNIEAKVKINSFNFIRIHREKFVDKLKDYFNLKLMPISAEVYYTLSTQIGDKVVTSKRKAVMSFKFSGADVNIKSGVFSQIKLIVTSYKNYELK